MDGPRSNPRLLVVGCGTKAAAYKVVQRVETPGQCVADVDDKFYNNPPGGQWTACLDYVWSSQDCLSVGLGYSAFRVACDDRTVRNREKPTQLLADTTSANGCPDSGFAHPVRRFTVCTETQK
ncbi:MAG: hypothetical protein J0H22_15050 [Actinobacteria bacterium]|nr:hypothetical protein [Actinomycetota bacterium]